MWGIYIFIYLSGVILFWGFYYIFLCIWDLKVFFGFLLEFWKLEVGVGGGISSRCGKEFR